MKLTAKENKLVHATFSACENLKAHDVLLVDLRQADTYTDWVFIVSGTNDRQMRAIADRVVEAIYTVGGLHPLGVEGYEGGQWILIDFGSIVCHVFLAEVRENYHLEDIWPRVRPLKEKEIQALLTPKKRKAKVFPKKIIKKKTVAQKKISCTKQ
jgi:ribosome-associated protein